MTNEEKRQYYIGKSLPVGTLFRSMSGLPCVARSECRWERLAWSSTAETTDGILHERWAVLPGNVLWDSVPAPPCMNASDHVCFGDTCSECDAHEGQAEPPPTPASCACGASFVTNRRCKGNVCGECLAEQERAEYPKHGLVMAHAPQRPTEPKEECGVDGWHAWSTPAYESDI